MARMPALKILVWKLEGELSPETAAQWRLVLDSTRPDLQPEPHSARLDMPPQSVFVFEPLLTGGST